MILTVQERLTLLQVIPQQGNFATMKVLDELRMNLSYTEEQMKQWGIEANEETKMISWEENGEADIPIGEKATGIIVDALRKLDTEDKITEPAVSVYEKFIPTIE